MSICLKEESSNLSLSPYYQRQRMNEMLDKPSREQFFSKRAKKARKHEQKRRETAEQRRSSYEKLLNQSIQEKENEDAT